MLQIKIPPFFLDVQASLVFEKNEQIKSWFQLHLDYN